MTDISRVPQPLGECLFDRQARWRRDSIVAKVSVATLSAHGALGRPITAPSAR
jgi:hypothetical protein